MKEAKPVDSDWMNAVVGSLRKAVRWVMWGRFVPSIGGVLLLTGSFLKAYNTSQGGQDMDFVEVPSVVLLSVLVWEVGLGLWALGGLCPPITNILLLSTYGLFIVVQLYAGFRESPSCGCLGPVRISPWLMVLLDGVVFVSLWAWQPGPSSRPFAIHWGRLALTVAVFLIAVVPLVSAVTDPVPTAPLADLREDPDLTAKLKINTEAATPQTIAHQVSQATGKRITVSDDLAESKTQNMGSFQSGTLPAWSVMEWLAQQQAVPVRWDRTEDGYQLVRAARLGRYFPFVFSGLVLTFAAGYFLAVPVKAGSASSA